MHRHRGPTQQVVDEIKASGGEAVANTDEVSPWNGAHHLITQAVDTFGGLDVVVNNAGILARPACSSRRRRSSGMPIEVHLKWTFAPSRFAAE